MENTKRPKMWSRKGRCQECNVGTGSRHNKACRYAYEPLPDIKKVFQQGSENPEIGAELLRVVSEKQRLEGIILAIIWVLTFVTTWGIVFALSVIF